MNNLRFLFVLILVVLGGVIVWEVGQFTSIPVNGGPTQLNAVEIREYQGEHLSSVNDFHENSIIGPQYINETDYQLTVDGMVANKGVYSYNDVLSQYPHYSKVVTLFCVEGWDATIFWEGIRVQDLLAQADPDHRATTVIFHAHDGYTSSFPLDYFSQREIIMAYRMNNITLPAERGFPFVLVAEDKWGYKWIKWIERIELSDNANYKGYWEERGYSNEGNLNKSFFA